MRRREFIRLFGGAAVACPLGARAQQNPPSIGYLSALGEEQTSHLVAALRRGLSEAGFVDGKTIAIRYYYANGRYDHLPAEAAGFVRRPVSLIIAAGPPAALSAKTATTTIPIVFIVGLDPVAAGLVATFNRPGGNATGISLITGPLGQKRLEVLRELVPTASVVAMLVNPISPDTAPEIRDVEAAAQANHLTIKLFNASTSSEIDVAFLSMAGARPDALLVASDPFYTDRREQIAAWAAKLRIATIYPFREFAMAGGLMSYGTSLATAYRQAGIYAGRILKGDRPSDLPVLQPTMFELVLNLKTAEALGITVPATLHARTDEVIE